uniref:Uncharacterized protein n=1 Tax=Anguilla anguilla TaxID=7936 RepID=A0A0E9VIC7_ANGAN
MLEIKFGGICMCTNIFHYHECQINESVCHILQGGVLMGYCTQQTY